MFMKLAEYRVAQVVYWIYLLLEEGNLQAWSLFYFGSAVGFRALYQHGSISFLSFSSPHEVMPC